MQCTTADVEAFARKWPGFGPRVPITFQFDKRSGDLVDVHGSRDAHDPSGVRALSEDAQRYGAAKFAPPALRVVFRKFREGYVIAFFCNSAKDCNPGNVMSYMHTGQHGEVSRSLGRDLKLATPEEYAPLLAELRRVYHPRSVEPVKRLVA
ncbi:hypothetical protein H1O16_gp066 [Burkholderia phage BcepSaruman]|uniref:Uncharacterized protein n=1 Tax=Burkholderia phage BcepSaruman TaxID=2530032 RepID=A0A4D5ZCR9_9CAUD|nr:hypothetical protein H1O16_gp066 [Burkholderia phage BcepSaruman]QBX06479.1 hypothetical protein BcepSaruman_066 [Burkholderia phage BcepSaruman]